MSPRTLKPVWLSFAAGSEKLAGPAAVPRPSAMWPVVAKVAIPAATAPAAMQPSKQGEAASHSKEGLAAARAGAMGQAPSRFSAGEGPEGRAGLGHRWSCRSFLFCFSSFIFP